MRLSLAGQGLLVVVALINAGCNASTEPDKSSRPIAFQKCLPEDCGGGGGGGGGGAVDPNPSAPGYWGGTFYTPANCFSANGVGINDFDHDGMNDPCESYLADLFRPGLSTAPANYDCDNGKDPYWAAKYFPGHGNTVRILYAEAWYRDCTGGPAFWTAIENFFAWVNINVQIGPIHALHIDVVSTSESHSGDPEFITVDLQYDATTQHWYLTQAFYSQDFDAAHDKPYVSAGTLTYPDKVNGYPLIYVRYNYHRNYATKSACGSDCNANPTIGPFPRLDAWGNRNLGSQMVHTINCVPSSNPTFYPGTECFWDQNRHFQGWLQYPDGPAAQPYYSQLMAKFECYSYTMSGNDMNCSDWGIDSTQLP